MRQICLDTETTGTEPEKGDRILEVGCVEIVGRQVYKDEPKYLFHELINPERDIPQEVVNIHGISNEVVADKPVFAGICDQFLEFVKGAELIIHNAEFDVGFINAELKRLKKGRLEDYCPVITDSLAMARKRFPGMQNNLDVLCTRFEIDKSARTLHGALLDAQLLAEVYLAMTREQGTLIGDAMDEMLREEIPPLPKAEDLVVAVTPEEDRKAHLAFLSDKYKKKPALWSQLLQPGATEEAAPEAQSSEH